MHQFPSPTLDQSLLSLLAREADHSSLVSCPATPTPHTTRPYTALPMHLPQLIPAIQHYHWVLKTCHSGAELDTALTCAQGFVDPDLR